LGVGGWGCGCWGLGFWPKPPTPNPQSPLIEHNLILINIFNKKIKIKNCFFFIAPIIEYYFIIFKQK